MNTDPAANLAKYLLEVKAVKISPDEPFTWTSGLRSPIYCDNRVLLSYPEIRSFLKTQLAAAARTHFSDATAVSGVATAGIAHGALLADALNLPFSYVRPEPKKHGLKNQIEGRLEPNGKILVVEDLISTGKSSLAAVKALQDAGAEICGMLALFSYNFPETADKFHDAGIRLHTLCDLDRLLPVAADTGYVDPDKLEHIRKFIGAPGAWWEE
jgi:orotate phosphoribosyltransferase